MSSTTIDATSVPSSQPVGHPPPEAAVDQERRRPPRDGHAQQDEPAPYRGRLPEERRPHDLDEVIQRVEIGEQPESPPELLAAEEYRRHEHRDLQQARDHLLDVAVPGTDQAEQR